MSAEFKVQLQDGSELSVAPSRLVTDLNEAGVPAKLSGDGFTVEYELDGQAMTRPVRDLLADSVGTVTGFGFGEGANYGTVDPELRLAIEQMPNDSMKQKYLEFAMTTRGIEAPKVIGMGSDWGFVDPSDGQLKPLTNRPGMDMSDLFQVAPEAARFLGATLGGAAGLAAGGGASAGIGAVPGAMVGAGSGSALARGALQGVTALTSDNYADFLKQLSTDDQKALLSDVMQGSAVDAIGTGVFGGLGAGIKTLAPGVARAFGSSPISKTAEKTAGFAEDAFGLAANTAKQVNNPFVRGVGAEVVAGAGPAQLAGMAAAFPAWAVRNAPKGMQKVANAFGVKSPRLEKFAEEIIPADRFGERFARAIRRNFGNEPLPQSRFGGPDAGDVLSRGFGAIGRKFGSMREPVGDISEEAVRRAGSAGPFRPQDLARETDNLEKLAREASQRTARYEASGIRAGQTIGKGLEGFATVGRGIDKGIDLAANAALTGVQGLSRVGQIAAGVPRFAAQLTAPIEARSYSYLPSRIAEEEFLRRN